MQKFSTILTSIALLALVAAIALLAWPSTSAAQDPTTDSRKRITVEGVGEVEVTPDIARVTIGVQTTGDDAASAVEQNNTQMQAVIEQLKAAGIADEDIQTSNFSIYPRYDYNGQADEIIGYEVSNTVQVTIPIQSASDTLDTVVAVGANNISGISFEVADPAAALAEARAQAMQNALERAEDYAAASNAQVGEVLVISEQPGDGMPLMARGVAMEQAADASVPIQPGQQTQRISVTVTFALK